MFVWKLANRGTSGRGDIATGYDGANRPAWLQGTSGTAVTPYIGNNANSGNWMQYWPSGEARAFFRGNNLWHAAILSGRLQTVESYEALGNVDGPATTLFQACPGWGFSNAAATVSNNGVSTPNDCPAVSGTQDNGNLWAYDEYAGSPGYDAVNRLNSAAGGSSWSQTYNYDQFGNMWQPAGSLGAPPLGPGAPTANVYNGNRNTNSTYDGAGNLTLFGSVALSYDAESRQTAAGPNTYSYDGAGQRVGKTTASGSTVYVYDAFGQLAAEYSTAVANSPCTTCYLSYDYLGSLRMVTDASANVVGRHDYAPFGQEIPAGVDGRTSLWGASDNVNQKFTGQVRDAETNLDFFNARYLSSGLGRFTSADPANAGADITNPQSWNAYAYVLGNPLALVDPSGLCSSSDHPPCYSVVTAVAGDPDFATSTNGVDLSSWLSFLNYGLSLLLGTSGSGPGGGAVPVYTVTGTGVAGRNPQPVATLPNRTLTLRLPSSSGGGAPPSGGTKQSDGLDWTKIGSCLASSAANHYGLTAVAGVSGLLALPIPKSLVPPYKVIGTPTTNLLSILGRYVNIDVPLTTIAGRTSGNLLRIAGRANPYIFAGLLAIDAGAIGYNTYSCYQQTTNGAGGSQ